MKKLIVVATKKEVQPLLDKSEKNDNNLYELSNTVDILITAQE